MGNEKMVFMKNIGSDVAIGALNNPDGFILFSGDVSDEVENEIIQRAVAAWNYCEGVPTSELENNGADAGFWGRACSRLQTERDKLQEENARLKQQIIELGSPTITAMNTTVDFETAKELREAGFPQPEPKDGQFYFNPSGVKSIIISGYLVGRFDSICLLDGELQTDLSIGDITGGSVFFAPTATEIIEKMPIGTTIGTLVDPANTDTIWECTFPLPMMQHDSRFDKCPHKCAALAYIAWAKGKAE